MKLTEQVIKTFRSVKTFRENSSRINSLDYSVQGDTLISSSDDESIVIYDCQTGTYVSLRRLFGLNENLIIFVVFFEY